MQVPLRAPRFPVAGSRLKALYGRASTFSLPLGPNIEPAGLRGYYIDFREKAAAPKWPPPWFPFPGFHRFIAIGQWGLGAFEHYLETGDEQWLEAAADAGRYLVSEQESEGHLAGAWPEPCDYPHTFRMKGPWLSGMAQGHCASLLVRLYHETGSPEMAEASQKALGPMGIPHAEGGVAAELDGRALPEEYPTSPPSFVLNGAIYAVWGYHDVAQGLADSEAGARFQEATETLVTNIARWDTGYWSRYDLYRHPLGVTNIASPSYHALHINQLRALFLLTRNAEFTNFADRFTTYANRAANRGLALAHKVMFRLIVPRNEVLASRLPWTGRGH
jgi:heparosan-N-sulfate-glucuronate 5-epimerase